MAALPLALLRLSATASAIGANAAWHDLTGIDEQGSLGCGWEGAVAPDECDRLRDALVGAAAHGDRGSADVRLHGATAECWSRWWWGPDADDGLVVCVADIDADKGREADLWQRATHDPLTGLVNRSEFLSLLERAVRRSERSGTSTALVFVDLDGFKAVNDHSGHAAGDQVLRTVAHRIRGAVRPADVAARVGGDEFAVLCEDIDGSEEAHAVAQRLQDAVREPIGSPAGVTTLSAATGIALATEADTAESLLARADEAMYAAKGHARRTARSIRSATPIPLHPSLTASASGGPRPADLQRRSGRTGDRSEEPPGEERVAAEIADMAVNRAMGVGLVLQSATGLVDGLAAERVHSAIDELDWLVHDLRADILHLRRGVPSTPTGDAVEAVMESLLAAERLLALLWANAVAGDDAAVDAGVRTRLADATKLTRSALRALDSHSSL